MLSCPQPATIPLTVNQPSLTVTLSKTLVPEGTAASGQPQHTSPDHCPVPHSPKGQRLRAIPPTAVHPAINPLQVVPSATNIPQQGTPWSVLRHHRSQLPGHAAPGAAAHRSVGNSPCVNGSATFSPYPGHPLLDQPAATVPSATCSGASSATDASQRELYRPWCQRPGQGSLGSATTGSHGQGPCAPCLGAGRPWQHQPWHGHSPRAQPTPMGVSVPGAPSEAQNPRSCCTRNHRLRTRPQRYLRADRPEQTPTDSVTYGRSLAAAAKHTMGEADHCNQRAASTSIAR